MKYLIFGIILISASGCINHKTTEEDLIKIDLEFSDYSSTHGMKAAFLSYFHQEGTLLRKNNPPIEGYEKIVEYFSKFDDRNFELTWEPTFAHLSKSGELGYTYGIYEFKSKSDSSTETEKGTYITIWKLDDNNQWKAILDSGNEGIGE